MSKGCNSLLLRYTRGCNVAGEITCEPQLARTTDGVSCLYPLVLSALGYDAVTMTQRNNASMITTYTGFLSFICDPFHLFASRCTTNLIFDMAKLWEYLQHGSTFTQPIPMSCLRMTTEAATELEWLFSYTRAVSGSDAVWDESASSSEDRRTRSRCSSLVALNTDHTSFPKLRNLVPDYLSCLAICSIMECTWA